MKTITVKRTVLTTEEAEVRNTWGKTWAKMVKDVRTDGSTQLIFGRWSGYTPNQSRVCHVDWISKQDAKKLALRSITFTDGTTLDVWVSSMALQNVLDMDYRRNPQYGLLVGKAMAKGLPTYSVADEQ